MAPHKVRAYNHVITPPSLLTAFSTGSSPIYPQAAIDVWNSTITIRRQSAIIAHEMPRVLERVPTPIDAQSPRDIPTLYSAYIPPLAIAPGKDASKLSFQRALGVNMPNRTAKIIITGTIILQTPAMPSTPLITTATPNIRVISAPAQPEIGKNSPHRAEAPASIAPAETTAPITILAYSTPPALGNKKRHRLFISPSDLLAA